MSAVCCCVRVYIDKNPVHRLLDAHPRVYPMHLGCISTREHVTSIRHRVETCDVDFISTFRHDQTDLRTKRPISSAILIIVKVAQQTHHKSLIFGDLIPINPLILRQTSCTFLSTILLGATSELKLVFLAAYLRYSSLIRAFLLITFASCFITKADRFWNRKSNYLDNLSYFSE